MKIQRSVWFSLLVGTKQKMKRLWLGGGEGGEWLLMLLMLLFMVVVVVVCVLYYDGK